MKYDNFGEILAQLDCVTQLTFESEGLKRYAITRNPSFYVVYSMDGSIATVFDEIRRSDISERYVELYNMNRRVGSLRIADVMLG